MNKKGLIQLVVIVACFSASAIVIYNNFIKKPDIAAIPFTAPNGSPAVANINDPLLPNGNTFDLEKLKNSSLRFNLIDYPTLQYPTEVGVDELSVIKPLKLAQDASKAPGK
jgi:hypothetical protein